MKRLLSAVLFLAVPATAQDAPFDWKLRPEVGSKWQMRSFSRTKVTVQEVNKKPENLTVVAPSETILLGKRSIDWEIISRDDQGAFTTRITFRSQENWVSGKSRGKPLSQEEQVAELASDRLFARFSKDKHFLLKIAPNGRIWNSVGLKELQRNWRKTAIEAGQDATDLPVMLEEKYIESLLGADTLPTRPLQQGDKYSSYYEIAVGVQSPIEAYGVRECTRRNNARADFIDEFKLKTSPPLEEISNKPTSGVDVIFQGAGRGRLSVDEASGFVLDSYVSGRMIGDVNLQESVTISALKVRLWSASEDHTVMEPLD